MAVSTTLMTFLVRTPSTTRSVDLYGSWDNFSSPYRMSRDVRLGMEHWSGCHTFENIICDGKVDDRAVSRSGALKMGGTYWYYYKLDDEIEFHNSSEPSTTRCPLLPGQLVNELQVPLVLSGSRKRDASVSSTSSERHTLDPEAKFINPRPAPQLPTLDRLRTSPTFSHTPPVITSPATCPVSATSTSYTDKGVEVRSDVPEPFQLPRKLSLDGSLKDGSPKKKAAGLRSPFQSPDTDFSADRSEKYQDIIDWIPDRHVKEQKQTATSLDLTALLETHHPRPPRGALLLRSNSEEAVTLASFREHRRQRSRSRSRNGRVELSQDAIRYDQALPLDLSTRPDIEPGTLSALIEVNTPTTPGYGPQTGRRMTLEALEGRGVGGSNSGKRLSTLPSTSSSAYPKNFLDVSPQRYHSNPETDQSRFSATTIDSTCHLDSIIIDQNQHNQFLESFEIAWSPEAEDFAKQDVYHSKVAEEFDVTVLRPGSSDVTLSSRSSNDEDFEHSRLTSATLNYNTMHSAASTTPTTSCGDSDSVGNGHFSYATSTRSSQDSVKNYQHYSLPEIDNPSEITLKQYDTQDHVYSAGRPQASHHTSFSHSEGMQQLLSELSYLSELIQR